MNISLIWDTGMVFLQVRGSWKSMGCIALYMSVSMMAGIVFNTPVTHTQREKVLWPWNRVCVSSQHVPVYIHVYTHTYIDWSSDCTGKLTFLSSFFMIRSFCIDFPILLTIIWWKTCSTLTRWCGCAFRMDPSFLSCMLLLILVLFSLKKKKTY